MAGWRDFLEEAYDYGKSLVEERVGFTMVRRDELDSLEAVQQDYRAVERQLDFLGWNVLNSMTGSPHEMKPQTRLRAVEQARKAWQFDPMAGRYTDLMNEFVFGRGVPRPRARNPEVQKVVDAAWEDPDNAAVLTGYMAQMAAGTDLTLQSNLFVLFFADGDDGKVKLSFLDHDKVFDVVRDEENRMRVLYYVAYYSEMAWDYSKNMAVPVPPPPGTAPGAPQVRYYAHWKNVADAEADAAAGLRTAPEKPPKNMMGEGLVYHIAVNRRSEQVFGTPIMQRSMRWFSAYNDLMSARVDMAKAASELIMKRKVKGGPGALARLAQQAISGRGEIATTPDPTRVGGIPGGTVIENENVTHDKFNLDSGAGNAQMDATMIRSQVSAGVGLPQHYLGDQGNANLATATAMDLPVTKMIEARQELFEQLLRAFTDMAIERAVAVGTITGDLPGEENAEVADPSRVGESESDGKKIDGSPDDEGAGTTADGKMDLSYEFKMPNPLRRLMTDLLTGLSTIAKTFDPNGTNVELSRVLLTVALGEGLEMQDPADLVGEIFPKGYIDPLVEMELQQGAAGIAAAETPQQSQNAADDAAPGGSGLTLQDLQAQKAAGGEPGSGKRTQYGAKSKGTLPEEVKEAIIERALAMAETRFTDLPEAQQAAANRRANDWDDEFDKIVGSVAESVVNGMPMLAGTNGHVRT